MRDSGGVALSRNTCKAMTENAIAVPNCSLYSRERAVLEDQTNVQLDKRVSEHEVVWGLALRAIATHTGATDPRDRHCLRLASHPLQHAPWRAAHF